MTTPETSAIRVAIVEDNDLIRQGLSDMINEAHDMRVCGTAADLSAAVALIDRERPDVALVDLALDSGSGYDVLARGLEIQPGLHALIVSSMHPSGHVKRALQNGAKGYIAKHEAAGHVTHAIKAVVRGAIYVSPDAARWGLDAG